MKMNRAQWVPYVIAASAGVALETGITYFFRRREAWDNPAYFTIGLPVVCAIAGLLGWFFPNPRRNWLWGFIPFMAEGALLFVKDPAANLFPIGLVFLGILSLPAIGCAKLGAWLHHRFSRTERAKAE